MKKNREPQIQTSFRLSKTGYDILQCISQEWGVGRKDVVEILLRYADEQKTGDEQESWKGPARRMGRGIEARRSPGRQKSGGTDPAHPAGSGKNRSAKG
jgi:hypothetical protein